MPVFAMTREMGTRGKDVAAGLAEVLGLEIVHHELVERHIAERLNIGESAVHRFLEGHSSLLDRWQIDRKKLSRFTAEEVLQLAVKGNVLIRGWGAAQLLSDVSHVICVRVCSPMANRIAEMSRRLGIEDPRIVEREIERNDDAHERTVQRQFARNWRDPLTYDIVLNTGRMPVDACVAQLKSLAAHPAYQETPASLGKLDDKLIEARVRTVLDIEVVDLPYGSGLHVAVSEGVVTMSGVVTGMRVHRPVIDRVAKLDGVVSVRDEVAVVAQSYGV